MVLALLVEIYLLRDLRQSLLISKVLSGYLQDLSVFSLQDALKGYHHHFFLFILGKLRPVLFHLILSGECESESMHMRFVSGIDGSVLGKVELQGIFFISDDVR